LPTPRQIEANIQEHSRAARHLMAEKGARTWSATDQSKFDGHMEEVERLESTLAATPSASRRDHALRSQYREGLEIFLRKNPRQMTDSERAKVKNVMSTTTGSQGGFTVPALVAQDLVSLLKGYGFMRRVATEFTTESGADMGMPTSDGTAEVGELVQQNSSATALDPNFNTRAMNTYKCSSKVFTLPIELLMDSQVDIVGDVLQCARDRIGRVQNPFFTTGTGSGQPTGLVPAAAVGKTGITGQTLTIIYDDLVDLVDSLDDAHFGMPTAGGATPDRLPGWMFSQSMRKVIRKVKDTSGRPIWAPSYSDGKLPGTTGQLLDYPVYINNDMAAPAANAKTVAFGNLHSYAIRDALDVTMSRFEDSAYMTKGQVGFLAWARAGGNLLDLGAVKLYQHSAT